jgi:hypothetical protein
MRALARFGRTPPKRARRLFDASVDPTDARDAVGFGPDVRVVLGQ